MSKVVIVAVDLWGHSKRQVKMGRRVQFNTEFNTEGGGFLKDVAIIYNF